MEGCTNREDMEPEKLRTHIVDHLAALAHHAHTPMARDLFCLFKLCCMRMFRVINAVTLGILLSVGALRDIVRQPRQSTKTHCE